jgi:hypothetical protein
MYAPLTAFLGLVVTHWIADFVCQTNWQASNKSKSNWALYCHVGTYTVVLLFGTILLFPTKGYPGGPLFIFGNALLHFWTDWCTSRVTSRLFMSQFDELAIVMQPPSLHGDMSPIVEPHLVMKRGFTLHNFFVIVGLDQLIHHVTLATTMLYCFY